MGMVSQGSSLTLSSTHDHPKSDLMSESIVQTLLELWQLSATTSLSVEVTGFTSLKTHGKTAFY